MKGSGLRLTRSLEPPETAGVHFRILCMTGKNKGVAYFISAKRLVMGRAEDAEIQVLDSKSSREHAELVKDKDGYILTDLGSQNGILVNNFKIKQHILSDGDKIIIGQTVFQFSKFVIEQSEDTVEDDNANEEEHSSNQEINENPKKSKTLILGAALLGGVYFLFPDEKNINDSNKPERGTASKTSSDHLDDLINKQIHNTGKEVRKKVAEYIHRGQREFREGNYFRAIEEFNLALVLSPNHGDAEFYLNKTKQELDRHIKNMANKGSREYGQLRYDGALKSYCEIIKLLQRYPEDSRYKEAKERIGVIEQKVGKEKDEHKCEE